MFTRDQPIVLTEAERNELETRARSRSMPASDIRRASLILMLASDQPWSAIRLRLGCTNGFIARWRRRFLEGRLDGAYARHQGRRRSKDSVRLEARILKATMQPPTDGTTHWSARRLAAKLGVNHMQVARAWERAGLQPHRVESYVASNDPDFEAKALDVIGLYLNPPQHSIVFSVDEKTAIQALDRTLPVLPFSPGRAQRHGFEYVRNGTLSLYAALDVASGKVQGKTVERHTSSEFVAFLSSLVAEQPADREVHIILDNLSAHKTKLVNEFLGRHPNVRLHFTPTYSSWLNQVELWLNKLERQVIARGVFRSTSDLARKLLRYIREHKKTAQPIKWKYSDPTRRMRAPLSSVTAH
ncbi:MAG TPA: IS630 family transposase [Candidatus Dormibacteraeota bacterium]|nr:IS630 family transposase [Candidatus Dormibacteraeota bacterium]